MNHNYFIHILVLCFSFHTFAVNAGPTEASAQSTASPSAKSGESAVTATSDDADGQMWYVQLDGSARGPFTAVQIGNMLKQGIILPETQVAQVGARIWSPAAKAFAGDNAILTVVADSPMPKRGKELMTAGIIFAGIGAAMLLGSILLCMDFDMGTDAASLDHNKDCALGLAIPGGVFLLGGAVMTMVGVSRRSAYRGWERQQLFPGVFRMSMSHTGSGVYWHVSF